MMTEQEAVERAVEHPGLAARWLEIAAYIRDMNEREKYHDGSVPTRGLVFARTFARFEVPKTIELFGRCMADEPIDGSGYVIDVRRL